MHPESHYKNNAGPFRSSNFVMKLLKHTAIFARSIHHHRPLLPISRKDEPDIATSVNEMDGFHQ